MEIMEHFELFKKELFQSISDGHDLAFVSKGQFCYFLFY